MWTTPQAIVGRRIRVYWQDDDAWFVGNVTHWDPLTGRHKVGGCLKLVSLQIGSQYLILCDQYRYSV
jgi:hypothetical protein